MGLDYINLQESEFDEAKRYILGHLEGTIGFWTEDKVTDTLKNWRLEQQQERDRLENQRRLNEEQERFNQEQENQQAENPSDTSWGQSASNVSSASMVAESQESFDMKEKRSEVASKVMPLASNQQLRNLLQDLCDNGDIRTLDIMMKYV